MYCATLYYKVLPWHTTTNYSVAWTKYWLVIDENYGKGLKNADLVVLAKFTLTPSPYPGEV